MSPLFSCNRPPWAGTFKARITGSMFPEKSDYSNIAIICGGQEFKAHRTLGGNFMEAQTDDVELRHDWP
jgi:hypothetical protein